MLKGDDFEEMEAWREWTSNKPDMAQLNADLLRWWSKGQKMSTEIAKLKAELEEAREIIQRFADCAWTEPSMSGGEKLMGLNAPKYMQVHPDARVFLDKAGK